MKISYLMKVTVDTDQIPEESMDDLDRVSIEKVMQYVCAEMGWVKGNGIHLDWIQSIISLGL